MKNTLVSRGSSSSRSASKHTVPVNASLTFACPEGHVFSHNWYLKPQAKIRCFDDGQFNPPSTSFAWNLRVEMVDRDDKYRRAVYNTFTIESSSFPLPIVSGRFRPIPIRWRSRGCHAIREWRGIRPGPITLFKPGVLRRTFCSSVNFFADYDENDERPSEQAIFWDTGSFQRRLKQIELTIRPKDTNYNASMTNYFENYRNSLESNEYGTVYTEEVHRTAFAGSK
ncbi:hypothetical protein TCAL_17288 [Tigriopus californicus]|uniref:Sushi domain-containing protein n=1 Tax=Tigriopus californicus TaxID=6832 RepID=A0A553NYV9_TIGCA|nr:hypothetical protein TCAL_17288 [Tigriopus californicus]